MFHHFPNFRKAIMAGTAILLICMPVSNIAVYAEDPTACTAPSPTQSGVRWPTGSDAGAFTYQCSGPSAGKWLNAYYLYDPTTNSRTALFSPQYHYDCSTEQWYVTTWEYSAAQGSYFQNTVASSDPGQATGCPLPPPPTAEPLPPQPAQATSGGSGNGSSSEQNTAASATTSNPNSNTPTTSNHATIGANTTTGASMHNGVISFANSGGAAVVGNTQAGSAASGNTMVLANVINMLQSSANVLNAPNMLTFTADINGDVNGDLLLDPAVLHSIQPANPATASGSTVTVQNSTNTGIENNIALGAETGGATVKDNTDAGDATTGNAHAVANIVNVLNSAITAGQSFLGVININGNLNGDILLPPNFIDTLIASNVPRYSLANPSDTTNSSLSNTANQSIANAITTSASSGAANVVDNTRAGSAQTGLAKTNVTVFNLTGSNLVASNDLLVFVNVLGSWYGLILNAPAGTTAASLGGGVDQYTTVGDVAAVNISNDSTQTIANNVHVAAKSGDATVAKNTSAGSARSGDATASVNLLNMINNSISLDGWFGILFINVFGTWHGSFGVNTAAGDPVHIPSPVAEATNASTQPQLFRFVSSSVSNVPGKQNSSGLSWSAATTDTSVRYDEPTSPAMVLASHVAKTPLTNITAQAPDAVRHNILVMLLGAALAFLILIFGERRRIFRHHYIRPTRESR